VRELNIAEYLLGHNHPHVIPILDAGRDASTGDDFIVMAQAQQSLQDLVDKAAPLAEADALEIIDAIASGLMEIGELVHRDLKPGNVLLHNGVWKLSDLGLARYVEDTTSANTMKRALSPPYAAPEQWRLERATKATDVYALGCIIHALLTGDPPFPRGDLSHLHQFEPPPALAASDRLRSLADACLAKSPQLRPTLQSIRAQVLRARQMLGSPTPSALAAVGAALAEEQAKTEALRAREAKSSLDLKALVQEAGVRVRQLLQQLLSQVTAEAPTAEIIPCDNENVNMVSYEVRLGRAALKAWIYPSLSKWMRQVCAEAGWEVLAGALIWIETPKSRSPGGSRSEYQSANLWFGKLSQDSASQWWEAAYLTGAPQEAPIGLDHWRENIEPRLADGPWLIDGEHVDGFFDRWTNRLAEAARQQA
jgi:hypothetical protein